MRAVYHRFAIGLISWWKGYQQLIGQNVLLFLTSFNNAYANFSASNLFFQTAKNYAIFEASQTSIG